ncbi:MAG TPA: hypothetical protein DEB46_14835 [Myxococcales bacterium]|jgi:tetratricopeptide (TPR) repeat protein|nr:hypothetical protein [Myxococcales bacterium]HBU49578.1 hypothetical protein [Myxococcales bacterium]|tara:strand:+ start:495 stop:2321 length:1827 start_codon:yes stop_codon:yes gene_type:complete
MKPFLIMITLSLPSVSFGGVENRVHQLLNQWRTAEAAKEAEALLATMPDLPAIQEAAARVKFFQGRYEDALDLLRRARAAAKRDSPLLPLIQATYEETRDHVAYAGKHFTVHVPPGPDQVLADYLIEALEEALARHGPRFGVTVKEPIRVEVYPSLESFARISTLSLEAIKTSGTIALCKFDRLMLVTPRVTLRGYDWLDTASHELIHLLISRRSHNTVPVWLHEGLAKYHESGWRGDYGEPLAPYSAELLAKAIQKDELISFARMSPSMALLPSQEATATAFAEVKTAIEYMLEKKGDGVVIGLLDSIREGRGQLDPAFKNLFQTDLQGFERSWAKWLKKRPMETVSGARKLALEFGENRSSADDMDPSRPDGPAGRRARLGDMLYRRGHHEAAAIEYQRAVDKAGTGYPGLVHRLADCLIASKSFEEAQKLLKKSAAQAPDDPRTWILLGRLGLRSERWQSSREAYEEANRINPFDPEVHDALAQLGIRLQDQELHQRELRAKARLQGAERPGSKEPSSNTTKDKDTAFITLISSPWAEILIDDQAIGRGTPLTDYPVSPGTHEIELRNTALGLKKRLRVTLKPGQRLHKEMTLGREKDDHDKPAK